MEIDVIQKNRVSFNSMQNQVGKFKAISIPMIFLGTFEEEIDAFIELAEAETNPSITEALIKRYVVIEEVLETLTKELTRISLKAEIAGTKMVDHLV